jgi:hypothetical protein
LLPFLRRSVLGSSWAVALGVVLVLAAAVLLPGLGRPGLWEPQERQLADRVAPPADLEKPEKPEKTTKPATKPPTPACERTQPEDAEARTLTADAAKYGRDLADSDGGRKLPFALMCLVAVLAAAGIAMRFAGPRAGIVTAIVLLSMPLLVLQGRLLTSDIGTACGATLLVYGLVALGARLGLGARGGIAVATVDVAVAIAALVAGQWFGFHGGGMLLGLVVPIGAFAAAGGLGVPSIAAAWRRESVVPHLPALLATVAAVSLLCVLAYQLYELRDLRHLVNPDDASPATRGPARAMFGHAVLAEGCWSSALGGVWNGTDDVRMVFDSTFEQIAYGTFPWGVLAPVAMVALLRDEDRAARGAGALALAWAACAWVASEAFQRKVGFTIYAGFPALAIAVGVWADRTLARRGHAPGGASNVGLRLLALFVVLGVLTFGLDMRSFPSRVTSLLIGGEQVAYPKSSTLLFVATKTWPVVLGVLTVLPLALALVAWADKLRARAFAATMAMTVGLAAFWAYAWHPRIAESLSSKVMFDTYRALRKPGDQLVIMGDLGNAPHDYADATPELVPSRDKVVKALSRPERVFAIAPLTELCSLHREMGKHRYYILEDRNVRDVLFSNKLDGGTDHNPLATMILHEPPANIPQKPKGRIVWDNKIELLGWSIPTRMERGEQVTVTMYYKVLAPVGGAWQVLMHIDGPARFSGDHKPIEDRCPTSTWQAGDYIVDTTTFTAAPGAKPTGRYDVLVGFFTGSNPNFRNMPLSEVPPEMKPDDTNRAKIMSVVVE